MSHSPPSLSSSTEFNNNNKNFTDKLVVQSRPGGACDEQSAASGCEGASVVDDEPLVLNATQEFDDYLFNANTSNNLTYHEKNNKHLSKRNKLLETREIETLTGNSMILSSFFDTISIIIAFYEIFFFFFILNRKLHNSFNKK